MHSANNNKTQKTGFVLQHNSICVSFFYILSEAHKKQRNDRVHKNICIFRLFSLRLAVYSHKYTQFLIFFILEKNIFEDIQYVSDFSLLYVYSLLFKRTQNCT